MIEEKRIHFIDNIYDPFYNIKFLEVEEYFYRNRESIKDRIVNSFRVSLTILNENVDFEISYIVCTLLKTNLLENKYVCTVMAYDEGFYISEGVKIGEIDFSDIYKYYEECHENGMKNFRRYIGALSEIDVKKISNEKLEKLNELVEKGIRYSLFDIIELKEYKNMNKANKFQFIVGEYFEFTTVIQIENINKKYIEMKNLLESEDLDTTFLVTEDFRELEFDKLLLKAKNLLFCDFNKSYLKSIVFELGILTGTRFTNAYLKSCTFYKCMMSETNFMNSRIVNCIFSEILMYIDCDGKKYTEVSFENCCFENVKFIGCVMQGVDFTKSNIQNVEIIETKFVQCVFSEIHRSFIENLDKNMLKENIFI